MNLSEVVIYNLSAKKIVSSNAVYLIEKPKDDIRSLIASYFIVRKIGK